MTAKQLSKSWDEFTGKVVRNGEVLGPPIPHPHGQNSVQETRHRPRGRCEFTDHPQGRRHVGSARSRRVSSPAPVAATNSELHPPLTLRDGKPGLGLACVTARGCPARSSIVIG
jgi:hypothetical protein